MTPLWFVLRQPPAVYSPIRIRTRVEGSKDPRDWPLHHGTMLRVGFEPTSIARKAIMIGRTTLPERARTLLRPFTTGHYHQRGVLY